MTAVVAFLALLILALVWVIIREHRRYDQRVDELQAAARSERAQLINTIKNGARVPDGRPTPAVTPRRTPEQQRALARVGTVDPWRPPVDGERK